MKKALIVVDMQKDFLDDAVLGNAQCRSVIPKIVEKIKEGGYDKIFATRDTHQKNYLQTQEGKNLPVPHCIEGSPGWQITEEIRQALDGCSVSVEYVNKPSFGSLELAERLVQDGIEEAEFVGVCTGICVISNAMLAKAKDPEMAIAVDASCCACVTEESHKTALEAMKLCQIAIENEI